MPDIITQAREYLSTHATPCGNDACVGDQAREVIEGLCAEVERLQKLLAPGTTRRTNAFGDEYSPYNIGDVAELDRRRRR